MSLHKQPPELLRLIMCEVDSPLDLYRLISASAPCLAVFSLSPELILASALKKAIPCDLLRYATAILNAPTEVPASKSLRREKLLPFLTQSFKGTPFDFPSTKPEMVALCRLHTRLVHLSDGFFNSTMHKLDVLGQGVAQPLQSSVETTKVVQSELDPTSRTTVRASESERMRIQKALLRFELYCKVFPVDEGLGDYSVYGADEQFDLFLSHLTPWEAEEMACIHQYFSSLLAVAVDEVEEQVVEAVLAAPGVRLPQPGRSINETDFGTWDDRYDTGKDRLFRFDTLERTNLWMFGGSDSKDRYAFHISYMISGGFDFMHQLVSTDKAGRVELIQGCHLLFPEFLPEALSCSPCLGPETIQPNGSREDDQSCGNLGYYLFKPPVQDTYMKICYSSVREYFLRDFGYVFWDAERIRTPAVFDKLHQASSREGVESRRLYDRDGHKNIEEQLEGVRLPLDELRRIEEEFGWI